MKQPIKYPYLPEGRSIEYVDAAHPFMVLAKEYARVQSLDGVVPTAAVIVQDGVVIGKGANGSDYHKTHQCQRVILGCKTGEGYELCEGCHPKNHSEPKAIQDANQKGYETKGADLYLWGHWWCCEPCWDVMIKAGIKNVFLLNESETLFNKEHPANIVGRQFVEAL
ncbi:MAG: hypothetical protein HY459_04290 [Parcubacteria group bacterium]|nr:hypothetical protein [Parcubacteria group bacterium]